MMTSAVADHGKTMSGKRKSQFAASSLIVPCRQRSSPLFMRVLALQFFSLLKFADIFAAISRISELAGNSPV